MNEFATMVKTIMSILDSKEEFKRRGIAHVVQDNNDEEAETKTTRKETEENMVVEDKMMRSINCIGR